MKPDTSFKRTVLLFVITAVIISCSQDAIFYLISQETAPTIPRIKGSPTKMVIFEREYTNLADPLNPILVPIMYVASGNSLYWYAQPVGGGDPGWDLSEHQIDQPIKPGDGERIIDLAATKNFLYALVMRDSSSMSFTLKRIGKTDSAWVIIGLNADYQNMQTIFADSGESVLFAGSRARSNSYAILFLDDSLPDPDQGLSQLNIILSVDDEPMSVRMLNGLAFSNDKFYLSTTGSGIFEVDISAAVAKQLVINDGHDGNNRMFSGIISLSPTSVIAVERFGMIYVLDENGFSTIKDTGDYDMTLGTRSSGALAVWKGNNDADEEKQLLLAGIESATYVYGYVEFDLMDDGPLDPMGGRREPGNPGINGVSSVDNNARYAGSLGKLPVKHLLQVPFEIDPDMTLFASTQNSGLWSYRKRGNESAHWNAEEE